MIKVENIDVFGFDAAVRGMRNPMNSWDKSDSRYILDEMDFIIGQADLDLMQRLYKAGPEHRKYLRMIHVQMDVTAPFYWWKEFDTYKVGTAANSCSTMHKITSRPLTREDFSVEHLGGAEFYMDRIISELNACIQLYNETKNKDYWWAVIQLLPSSYNQKRTIDFNYETAFNIIRQREGHKLDEWQEFIRILKKELPHIREIGGLDG